MTLGFKLQYTTPLKKNAHIGFQRRSKCGHLYCRAAAPQQLLVYVPPHSLVKHWVAVLRNKATPTPMFRAAAAELGRILAYEASKEWLPTLEGQVETPLGVADVTFIDPGRPVAVVPVLRAGLVLLEQAGSVLPSTVTYHVGYVRDEQTLKASCYLNKLPEKFSSEDLILVSDPMLATGGTMEAVLEEIISRGADASNVRIIAIVAAPPALKKLGENFPAVKVFCGMIDAEVDERGYIIPGLGDAGDRIFAVRKSISDALESIRDLETALTSNAPPPTLHSIINEHMNRMKNVSEQRDRLRGIEVPMELIAALDDGANPDSFVRDIFVECQQANQLSKGKVVSFLELRKKLSEKLKTPSPK